MLARIWSAVLVQTKGLGSSLCTSMNSRMDDDKPFETKTLANLVRDRLLTAKRSVSTPKETSGCDIAASKQRDRQRLAGEGQEEQRTQRCFSQRPRPHGISSEADRRLDSATEIDQCPRIGERFHLFRRRRCLRPDAKVTGLHFCHVGARLSNPSS